MPPSLLGISEPLVIDLLFCLILSHMGDYILAEEQLPALLEPHLVLEVLLHVVLDVDLPPPPVSLLPPLIAILELDLRPPPGLLVLVVLFLVDALILVLVEFLHKPPYYLDLLVIPLGVLLEVLALALLVVDGCGLLLLVAPDFLGLLGLLGVLVVAVLSSPAGHLT